MAITIDDSHPWNNWSYHAANYDWVTGAGTQGNPYEIKNVLIDGGGQNFLNNFAPIIFFLLLLALTKFLLSISWEHALWVSLLTLFLLYIIYSLIPELYSFVQFG